MFCFLRLPSIKCLDSTDVFHVHKIVFTFSNVILNIKTSLLLRLRCLCHIVVKKGLFEYQWNRMFFFLEQFFARKKINEIFWDATLEDSPTTRFSDKQDPGWKVTKQNSHKKVLRKPFHVFITQGQVPEITLFFVSVGEACYCRSKDKDAAYSLWKVRALK